MKLLYYRLFKSLTCANWPCKRCDAAGRTSWRSREAWHAQRPARRFLAKVRQILHRHDPIECWCELRPADAPVYSRPACPNCAPGYDCERGTYVPFGGAR